jgi:CheY-like chemotaxis protein
MFAVGCAVVSSLGAGPSAAALWSLDVRQRSCEIFSGLVRRSQKDAIVSSLKQDLQCAVIYFMNWSQAKEGAQTKVFVVDDDPVVLQIVREWLEKAGYLVSTRDQALGTAQWVAKEKPAYVLLDVKMPALSGAELTQIIRRHHTTSETVVILYSSMDAASLSLLARKTGAFGAIQKTSQSRLFLAEFERLVAQHRATGVGA